MRHSWRMSSWWSVSYVSGFLHLPTLTTTLDENVLWLSTGTLLTEESSKDFRMTASMDLSTSLSSRASDRNRVSSALRFWMRLTTSSRACVCESDSFCVTVFPGIGIWISQQLIAVANVTCYVRQSLSVQIRFRIPLVAFDTRDYDVLIVLSSKLFASLFHTRDYQESTSIRRHTLLLQA